MEDGDDERDDLGSYEVNHLEIGELDLKSTTGIYDSEEVKSVKPKQNHTFPIDTSQMGLLERIMTEQMSASLGFRDARSYLSSRQKEPMLHYARSGQIEDIERLVESGEDLELRAKTSLNTPLIEAAEMGRFRMVQGLMLLRANVDAVNKAGYDAFDVASRAGHEDIAIFLLENGAKVAELDEEDQDGYSPVMNAAIRGQARLLQALLDSGASVDAEKISTLTTLLYILQMTSEARWLRELGYQGLDSVLPSRVLMVVAAFLGPFPST